MDNKLNNLPLTPCAITVSIVCLVIASFFMPPQLSQDSYPMAFFDKQALLKTRPSPGIIFVGGSNVAYNIDSARVKQALQRNVINDGTQVGFGLYFMLNSIKKYLRTSDIVVICPEYEHFFGLAYGNEDLAHLVTANPSMLSNIQFDQIGKLLSSIRVMLLHKATHNMTELAKTILPAAKHQEAPTLHLGRSVFNEDGDIGCTLDKSIFPISGCWLPSYINQSAHFDPNTIKIINEFAQSVAQRHIKVIFCFPVISTTFYSGCQPALEAVSKQLENQLQIPVIGSLSSCVLPDKCFYDSRYHLLTHYKELQTSRIITDLGNFLSNNPSSTHFNQY
jgi:hypothetical protein